MSQKTSKVFYGWYIVGAMALVLAIMGPASVSVANIYQVPVIKEFNISPSTFALNNSIILGMGIFLPPLITRFFIGSKKQFKAFFIFSVVIYALAYAAYGFVHNISIFYILSLFVGFGYCATTILPTSILINNWFDKSKGLAMSLSFAGLGVGGVIFSNLLTVLIQTVGWRKTYLIYALIMIVVVIPIILFLVKLHPSELGLVKDGTVKKEISKDKPIELRKSVKLPFESIKKELFFYALIAGAALVGLSNNGGLGQFPPFLQELHGPAAAATIISIYSAVGILGKVLIGLISDKFGTLPAILFAAVLSVFAYIIAIFAGNFTFAILMALAFGLGNGVGTVGGPIVTARVVSEENYPKVYPYVQSGIQLGMTFGSLLAAGIATLSSYQVSWAVMAVISGLIFVAWAFAVKKAEPLMK